MFPAPKIPFLIIVLIVLAACKNSATQEAQINKKGLNYYTEAHRPQYHFSPETAWMNDPNGLVYHQGVYHLFYQYYPSDIVWGPMHWGHATSTDMIHWEHKPIALFPDKHGYIFSGSAVVDYKNTSGFGTLKNPALVAIFTYHLMEGEKEGRTDYQTQGIAYSLDNGDSWSVYQGNPVIGNPGMKDFRDPKVFWNEQTEAWTMLLVAGDHLQIWASDNLKDWQQQSEFGKGQGAHGGVWECPDLFPLSLAGADTQKWVLFISINPGAPNGGSGTQYFIGDFDGKTFTSDQTEALWVDGGTDNYAGVTYNDTPDNSRLFIGWMSNWNYAQLTPTQAWRSAMTLPRTLHLETVGGSVRLVSKPLAVINPANNSSVRYEIAAGSAPLLVTSDALNQSQIRFNWNGASVNLDFSNEKGQVLSLKLDAAVKTMTLDRSNSGFVDFEERFKNEQQMDWNPLEGENNLNIYMDASSIEVFVNGGQSVLTAQFFNQKPFTHLEISQPLEELLVLEHFEIRPLESIWR
jgi:fructan beta-fructosidase